MGDRGDEELGALVVQANTYAFRSTFMRLFTFLLLSPNSYYCQDPSK